MGPAFWDHLTGGGRHVNNIQMCTKNNNMVTTAPQIWAVHTENGTQESRLSGAGFSQKCHLSCIYLAAGRGNRLWRGCGIVSGLGVLHEWRRGHWRGCGPWQVDVLGSMYVRGERWELGSKRKGTHRPNFGFRWYLDVVSSQERFLNSDRPSFALGELTLVPVTEVGKRGGGEAGEARGVVGRAFPETMAVRRETLADFETMLSICCYIGLMGG